MGFHTLTDHTDNSLQVAPQSITSGAAVNGTTLDMQGWDDVMFEVNVGAITGSGTLDAYVQSGANSNASDMANITNAKLVQVVAANASNIFNITVIRPTNRYVRVVLLQATNTVIAGANAIRYRRGGILPLSTNSAIQDVIIQQN